MEKAVANGINMLDILPANPFHVEIYLSSLVQTSRIVIPLLQLSTAYTGRILLLGKTSLTESDSQKRVEGATRQLVSPIEKRNPLLLICYLNCIIQFSKRTILCHSVL